MYIKTWNYDTERQSYDIPNKIDIQILNFDIPSLKYHIKNWKLRNVLNTNSKLWQTKLWQGHIYDKV